ncbi:MAG: SEC-C domain-containing protein [Verrucomicrobiota bacterium]
MNQKLGRNDLCHCGSGKKYKRCHMAQDEMPRLAVAKPTPVAEESDMKSPGQEDLDMKSPGRVFSTLSKIKRKFFGKKWSKFEQLPSKTKPLVQFLGGPIEIEAAEQALKSHEAEFNKLLKDREGCLERAQALFSEERFAPLRFTGEEVGRVCERAGLLPNAAMRKEDVTKLNAALLSLADGERRNLIAMSLLTQLSDYVAAGRYLDGCLVQFCATRTLTVESESNPFLAQMFSYGYAEWTASQKARDMAILDQAGLDVERLQAMSPGEMEAWLQTQEDDPDAKQRMEALLKNNPEQKARALANLERMENDSSNLLLRTDSHFLFLRPEELASWLPKMAKASERLQIDVSGLDLDGPHTEESAHALFEVLLPLIREMAAAIFTPKRLRSMVSQLKTYRNQLAAAGEKDASILAQGAVMYLEREDQPELNSFLLALCFHSLSAVPPGFDPEEKRGLTR